MTRPHTWKHWLAGAGTLGLLAVGVQAIGVTAASAHTQTVSGAAACASSGGYQVTWTVTNTWPVASVVTVKTATPTVTAPVGSAFAPASLPLASSSATTGTVGQFVQTFSGSATTADLEIIGTYTDGYILDTTANSVTLPTNCAPVLPPHTAVAPTATNGGCLNNVQLGSPKLTINPDTGVTYTVGPVGSPGVATAPGTYPEAPGTYQVVASSTTYTLINKKTWNFTLTTSSVNCAKTVSPTTPTVTQSRCVNHSATSPSVTLPTTKGIKYTAVYNGGKATITATALPGYTFPTIVPGWTIVKGKETKTVTFLPPLNCGASATPVSPTVTEAVCTAGNTTPVAPTLTLVATKGITYTVPTHTSSYTSGQNVVVTATTDKGYYLAGLSSAWHFVSDTVATRDVTFSGASACVESVSATRASYTSEQCTSGATPRPGMYTIPASTGVVYKVNGAVTKTGTYNAPYGSTMTIVATPEAHYRLTGQTMWTRTFNTAAQCSNFAAVHVHRPATSTTHKVTSTPPSALASTGVPTEGLVGIGLGLLLVGGLLTFVTTRRRVGGSNG